MAQVGQILQLPVGAAGADLRLDTEKASVDRAAVMREAPETDGGFFKVPKVIWSCSQSRTLPSAFYPY